MSAANWTLNNQIIPKLSNKLHTHPTLRKLMLTKFITNLRKRQSSSKECASNQLFLANNVLTASAAFEIKIILFLHIK